MIASIDYIFIHAELVRGSGGSQRLVIAFFVTDVKTVNKYLYIVFVDGYMNSACLLRLYLCVPSGQESEEFGHGHCQIDAGFAAGETMASFPHFPTVPGGK